MTDKRSSAGRKKEVPPTAPSPLHRQGVEKDPRASVRLGQFDRVMEDFRNELRFEMQVKMAKAMGDGLILFHEMRVEPLYERIARLETFFLKRWFLDVRSWWAGRQIKKQLAEQEVVLDAAAEPATAPAPEAASEPEAAV